MYRTSQKTHQAPKVLESNQTGKACVHFSFAESYLVVTVTVVQIIEMVAIENGAGVSGSHEYAAVGSGEEDTVQRHLQYVIFEIGIEQIVYGDVKVCRPQ